MKRLLYFTVFLLIISEIMTTTSCKTNDTIHAPVAEKIKKKLVNFGNTRIDNYYWMNEHENPKVLKYLEDENAYTEKSLKHTEKLRETLFDEIAERIKPDDSSVPYKDNGYYYYQRYEEQEEHPIYCRKKEKLQNPEEILLDVNELAEGHPFFNVEDFSISYDNKLMAYSVDTLGRRRYEIHFKNLETEENLSDIIKNTDGELVWANDNKTVFYIRKDEETLREYQLWKHVLGTSPDKDIKVYEEDDDTFYISVSKSKSDKYIFLSVFSTLSTEYRYINAEKPNDKFHILIPRSENLEYHAEPHGNGLYILTNAGNAVNFKIVKTSFAKPNIQTAFEIVPYNKNVFIEDFDVFKNYLVINERKNGLMRLRVLNLKTSESKYIDCGEDAYEIWISDNDEFDTDILRFGYSSLTTPVSYYDYNMKTGEKILLKQKFAGKIFNKNNYQSKRLYATAADGVKIPISIVYKKGLKLNSTNPMLIYAYGSYGYSTDASFHSSVLSLLNRGFVYAVAHVRGGQENGRKWYEDGKLLHKKNTFTDFIACTKYLQDLGYSSPEYTFAEGGSAGGLLTGAVSNMHPDLYAGIIAEVPFVDVVTTMLDESVPLTTGEYDEWGNPHKKKYYDYMLSYSPYDNVKKQAYPAMLITAGLHDSQVQYWEPAKWTAKLREYNTSNNPIYLFTNMDAGHSGMSGRYKAYKETALIYAFILDILSEK
ncbi:MAG: S9 family peptidase [Chlorobi bacterium]|nr:S9 family peptidase [Chlorobiota bacterium]